MEEYMGDYGYYMVLGLTTVNRLP